MKARIAILLLLMLIPFKVFSAIKYSEYTGLTLNQARNIELDESVLYNLRDHNREIFCLAQSAFFEARGEGFRGMVAVSEVVKNRADHPDYPDTLCGVINQIGYVKGKKVCQFSWVCNKRRITDILNSKYLKDSTLESWEMSIKAALFVYYSDTNHVANGATHFHRVGLKTGWRGMKVVVSIRNHDFLKAR